MELKTRSELEMLDLGALVRERQEILGYIQQLDQLIFKRGPKRHGPPDPPVPPELSESDSPQPTRFAEPQLDASDKPGS